MEKGSERVCVLWNNWCFIVLFLIAFFARGNQNGIYLVRENQLIPGDYILSFSFDKKIAHFKINESRSLHYSVESGPIKKGNDYVIPRLNTSSV